MATCSSHPAPATHHASSAHHPGARHLETASGSGGRSPTVAALHCGLEAWVVLQVSCVQSRGHVLATKATVHVVPGKVDVAHHGCSASYNTSNVITLENICTHHVLPLLQKILFVHRSALKTLLRVFKGCQLTKKEMLNCRVGQ